MNAKTRAITSLHRDNFAAKVSGFCPDAASVNTTALYCRAVSGKAGGGSVSGLSPRTSKSLAAHPSNRPLAATHLLFGLLLFIGYLPLLFIYETLKINLPCLL